MSSLELPDVAETLQALRESGAFGPLSAEQREGWEHVKALATDALQGAVEALEKEDVDALTTACLVRIVTAHPQDAMTWAGQDA